MMNGWDRQHLVDIISTEIGAVRGDSSAPFRIMPIISFVEYLLKEQEGIIKKSFQEDVDVIDKNYFDCKKEMIRNHKRELEKEYQRGVESVPTGWVEKKGLEGNLVDRVPKEDKTYPETSLKDLVSPKDYKEIKRVRCF